MGRGELGRVRTCPWWVETGVSWDVSRTGVHVDRLTYDLLSCYGNSPGTSTRGSVLDLLELGQGPSLTLLRVLSDPES